MGSAGGIDESAQADSAIGASAYRAMVERARDLVAVYDADGRFVYASPSHKRAFGWTPDELVGMKSYDLLHPDERTEVIHAFTLQYLDPARPGPVAHRVRCKDGSWCWVESFVVDPREHLDIGAMVISRDATYRHRADGLAADQARILEKVARGAGLTVVLAEVTEMLERWLPNATGVVIMREGSRLEVVAAPNLPNECIAILEKLEPAQQNLQQDSRFCVTETRQLRPYGYQTSWSAPIGDGDFGGLGAVVVYLSVAREPSDSDRQLLEVAGNLAGICVERQLAERRIRDLALSDPLTGLMNRIVLHERLRELIENDATAETIGVVLFLDIDRLKVVNDSLGHSAGDRLLTALGRRLEGALRSGDMVARFGGDEFVVLCERVADVDEAHRIGERILDLVQQPFVIDAREIVVTASIGIAVIDASTPEALLRDADTAMYRAKEGGGGRVELFDGALRARATQRLDIEHELRRALANGEFRLHYQPAFVIETGQLVGFEALLRWQHPARGLLGPDAILPVAEEIGLISRIGMWAFATALYQARKWREAFPEWNPFVIGVNVAARQLAELGFVQEVSEFIQVTEIDPALVTMELTESAVLTEGPRAKGVLDELRHLGVHLALDDFGTGYSSLMHLKRFPIETIKIDQSFIKGLTIDRQDDAIVASLTRLAHELGIFVVAEGVETATQAQRLVELGCHIGQGHYWMPALPPSEIPGRLAAIQT